MFRKKFLSMVLLGGMLISQSVPSALAATYCDQAQFVSDLTAPDGSSFASGAAFTKTWRLMNAGTCTWTTSYNLVWAGGDALGSPAPVKLPVNVVPGQNPPRSHPCRPRYHLSWFPLRISANCS